MVTAAPVTTEPLGSVTEPRRDVVADCEIAIALHNWEAISTATCHERVHIGPLRLNVAFFAMSNGPGVGNSLRPGKNCRWAILQLQAGDFQEKFLGFPTATRARNWP